MVRRAAASSISEEVDPFAQCPDLRSLALLPAEPAGAAGESHELSGIGAVACGQVYVLAADEDDAVAVWRPGAIVGHDVAKSTQSSAGNLHDPEQIFSSANVKLRTAASTCHTRRSAAEGP